MFSLEFGQPILCMECIHPRRIGTVWIVTFFINLLPFFILAQNPVPDSLKRASSDSLAVDTIPTFFDRIKYRFIGDGNFTRGNVNRSLMVLRAEIIYDGPVVSVSSNPRFAYGQQNNVLAEREPYLDLFIDLYKQRKIYGFGLGTIEASHLRDITIRQLAGLGAGFRLVKTTHHSLVLTNAIIYESTNFGKRSDVEVIRNSARLKGKHSFFQDKIRLNHTTFVQPALNKANLRWNTLISLELPLSTWITLRTTFENAYESVVEVGRKHNDSRLTFGISVGNKN
jgi:hypothetical protein